MSSEIYALRLAFHMFFAFFLILQLFIMTLLRMILFFPSFYIALRILLAVPHMLFTNVVSSVNYLSIQMNMREILLYILRLRTTLVQEQRMLALRVQNLVHMLPYVGKGVHPSEMRNYLSELQEHRGAIETGADILFRLYVRFLVLMQRYVRDILHLPCD